MPYVNYNKVTDWTAEKILEKLATDDSWVEKALIVLYERQTETEQHIRETYVYNERGFQVADARLFTKYALKLKAGQHLSAFELSQCRRPWHRGKRPIPTIGKYRHQLLEMIERKAKERMMGAR